MPIQDNPTTIVAAPIDQRAPAYQTGGARADFIRSTKVVRYPLTAAVNTAGGVLALPCPEKVSVNVERLVINVTTAAAGTCTVDAGIAANATTSADNLIDGLDLRNSGNARIADNLGFGGSNGKSVQTWGPTQFLTISQATGDTTGLVGFAEVHYVTG